MNNKTGEKIFTGLFGITVAVFIIGLIVLSFFNHPSADDYFALLNDKHYGFAGFQHFVYLHWGGRYFSSLIAAVFSSHLFLTSHYYLHTVLLIVLTAFSAHILLKVINRFLINKSVNSIHLLILSLLISVNLYSVYPELSTALFWFSSAVTYQTSVILLMLIVAALISFLHVEDTKSKYFSLVSLILLIISNNGSNEVSGLLSAILMLIVFITNKRKFNSNKLYILLIVIIYLLSLLVLIIAPGNKERMTILDGKNINILFSVGSAFYRVFVVYFCLFQSALFWISIAGIFLYAVHVREKIFMLKHHKTTLKTIMLFIAVWTILLLMVLIPILILSNGSIPDRALNVLSAASLLAFFMVAFYMGICIKDKQARMVLGNLQLNYSVATVLLISIIAGNASKEIASSLISASTYHRAMTARENVLNNARLLNVDSIALPQTDAAMQLVLQNNDAGNQKATIKQWMKRKPSLLFVSDDLETPESRKILQQFYGLKTINATSH